MDKIMKLHKSIFIIVLFLIIITAIRLFWMSYLTTLDYSESPTAKEGVLDLRGWQLNDKKTFLLNGEWEFYPNRLLVENDQIEDGMKHYLENPSDWNDVFEKDHSFTYGTYRLRILLDDDHLDELGLKINKVNNASAIYVNGEKIGESGEVAVMKEKHKGTGVPFSVFFTPDDQEIELMIQASSNRHDGGMIKPIRFGTKKAIDFQSNVSIGLQLLLLIVLILHSIYAFILYFMRSSFNKGLLYFTSLLICAMFTVLCSDDKMLFQIISVDYNWEIKWTYLSYIGVATFIPLVINHIFPHIVYKKALIYFLIYCLLYTLFIMIASPMYILQTSKVFLLAVLLSSIVVSLMNFQKAKIDKGESIFLILGCLSIGNNILWSTIESNTSLEMLHYPFDLIIALLCFCAFWFKRFFRITTESENLAKKLQLENQRKDEFLVNTSHELRNPLNGITNIIQTLLEDEKHPLHIEHQKSLFLLEDVSKRMSFMLNDLLDITRLKENTIQLDRKKIIIQSVVTGVMDMTKLMSVGKQVLLKVEIPDDFPPIFADENRLIQILFNLLHNAIKFTDEGTITIRASIDNEMALVHIKDTGIGIKEEDLGSIFEPYEQAVNNDESARGGFGLGLRICKQLIELQNGTIHVQSTVGKGTIFTFSLPLFKGTDRLEQPEIPFSKEEDRLSGANVDIFLSDKKKSLQTGSKILAVDDDPVNLTILRTILERENYYVVTVMNAEEAINKLEKEMYDLVILDVMMPHISGYDFTRKIREHLSLLELPVLLLTARARPEDILAGFRSGANDYVTKPVDAWELRARVHALTNLKALMKERIRIEGAWLQSQIQPHFIFNTLNSIAALGEMDIKKMQGLLMEFSHYLRLSFDFHNAEPVVPLEYELSLVGSYLYIEQTRFGDRLKVEWETDDPIDVQIPPLSIQPLVENAIKHGIMQNTEGGTILIAMKEEKEHIKISVRDNGKGMPKEKIQQLFTEEQTEKRTSVGLRNVERRLKQFYGEGLIIESTLNIGTTVSFCIPKKRNE